jgi:hypothetical protein
MLRRSCSVRLSVLVELNTHFRLFLALGSHDIPSREQLMQGRPGETALHLTFRSWQARHAAADRFLGARLASTSEEVAGLSTLSMPYNQ